MALTKLGNYITEYDLRNSDDKYGEDSVVGISTQKMMIHTKADLMDVKLTSYKLLPPNHFAYVSDTSRRGDKMSLCFNNTTETYLVSSISTIFYVSDSEHLNSDYLFMYFNRPEFDRFARFNSWGSARETFTWEDMCDIDIDLPSLSIQQKYVDVYNSMLANQKSYERGLEDLKLTCDAYIEDLRRKHPCEEIGNFLLEVAEKNDGKYGIEYIKGVSIKKEFAETKADTNDLSTSNYKIVRKGQFAFNPNTARMGEKFCIAYNDFNKDILVSAIYPVFEINNITKLTPLYLMMFFKRDEFDRYVRYHSWGSAREVYNFEDLAQVRIPIPEIEVQKNIVSIFNAYNERKSINEKLKSQIKDICPILIKGSIEEAKREA